MIFFDRAEMESNRPKSLTDQKNMRSIQNAITEHMQLPLERREQTDIPPVWKTPFQDDVLSALAAGSKVCCAFCGLRGPLSVYRFRPPAYAQPKKPVEGDESYLWLSFEWGNLFPICAQCRPSNQNFFPVRGNRVGYGANVESEKADLIYPGELSQPYRHFSVNSDGYFLGLTRRARRTIEHFKLNAPEKSEARKDLQKNTERGSQSNEWEW